MCTPSISFELKCIAPVMFNIYTRLFGLYKKYSCPTNSKTVIRSFRFSTNNNCILKFNILELRCNTCFIIYIPTKSLKEFVDEINFSILLIKCYSFIDMFVCLKLFNKTCNLFFTGLKINHKKHLTHNI